uniref:Uncharacterized protein n=1 Tax=Scophthalmus maximus TaxID=52904 RepID=A0A8D3B6K2_SCOMX
MGEVQGHVNHILKTAGQRHQAELGQGVSKEDGMVGPPATQEHNDVGQDHPAVAVHAHAGQEEDAAEEVDGEQQVREFARHLAEGPVAVLGQRAHPHGQSGAHTQIRNCQMSDVHVSTCGMPPDPEKS